MSKYKTILIKFLEEKNKLVRKRTNMDLILPDDLNEVFTIWSENDCKTALMKLHARPDKNLCPWCMLFKCSTCGYGRRNGICATYTTNKYSTIIGKLWIRYTPNTLGIANIEGMEELANKYMKLVKRKGEIY